MNEMDISVSVVKVIKIARSGPGIVQFWEFDEDDAEVIYEALKQHFEPDVPEIGD